MFFNLTLISRALSRDAVLKRITKKARTFQKNLTIYDYSEHDALARAVPYFRYKLCTKFLRPKSDKDSGAGFDVWDFINDVLAGENVMLHGIIHGKYRLVYFGVPPECLEVLTSFHIMW